MQKPSKSTRAQAFLQAGLAPYACDPGQSRGRLYPEPEDETRSLFQRDRDRIIHSAAFRRLEYKTQVFVNHEGDHYRTRLTHSLEVAQLARSMSRALGLNEDLAEALALAHDLGHTPFGHAGEDGLTQVMESYGGFDHNAQTLRILTRLEHRYAAFDGLNLTWETLEGVAKHNGPLLAKGATAQQAAAALPRAMADYAAHQDLELDGYAGAEAQVASLSDDIAYNNHDIDDGLRSGLFTVVAIRELPFVGEAFAAVTQRFGSIDEHRLVHEAVRRMIHAMVLDVLKETRLRVESGRIRSVDDVRAMNGLLVAFSPEMGKNVGQLKEFLTVNMYRNWRVNRMTSKARRVVSGLFRFFLEEPQCLPPEWQKLTDGPATAQTAHAVCDFIAGMTDRFAIDEYERLFNPRSKT